MTLQYNLEGDSEIRDSMRDCEEDFSSIALRVRGMKKSISSLESPSISQLILIVSIISFLIIAAVAVLCALHVLTFGVSTIVALSVTGSICLGACSISLFSIYKKRHEYNDEYCRLQGLVIASQ